jgi:hypothetical protein
MLAPGCEAERTFSPEEKHYALAAVLQSQTFARADQLKKFLRYICEMEEAGRTAEISEYLIGIHALGRPADYSPADDSGVRGRAHSLRLKLQQFYQSERPDAEIRLGLRKGSYTPYYYEVPAPAEPKPVVALLPPPPPAPVTVPRKAQRSLPLAWTLGVVVLAVALGAVGQSLIFRPSRPDAIVREFWGPMLHPGSGVLLCLASPPSLLIKPFHNPPRRGTFRPVPPETADWYSRLRLPQAGATPYMYHSLEAPLFGDSAAAVKAAETIGAGGGSFQFLPESILGPAALRNRNVVLVGGPNYSAYAARVLSSTPFTIFEDEELGEETIRDRSPATGAAAAFVPKRDPSGQLVLVYGLITVFPNQTGAETGPRAIIVSGVTGAGAPAAMEFFASPAGLATLRASFAEDGLKNVPASYQVVVRGTRDGPLPLTWELAAYKVMQHPPTLE